MTFAHPAHRFGKDVDLDGGERAVGLRNRGGSDECSPCYRVDVRGSARGDRSLVGQLDRCALTGITFDCQLVAVDALHLAAHAVGRRLR